MTFEGPSQSKLFYDSIIMWFTNIHVTLKILALSKAPALVHYFQALASQSRVLLPCSFNKYKSQAKHFPGAYLAGVQSGWGESGCQSCVCFTWPAVSRGHNWCRSQQFLECWFYSAPLGSVWGQFGISLGGGSLKAGCDAFPCGLSVIFPQLYCLDCSAAHIVLLE